MILVGLIWYKWFEKFVVKVLGKYFINNSVELKIQLKINKIANNNNEKKNNSSQNYASTFSLVT